MNQLTTYKEKFDGHHVMVKIMIQISWEVKHHQRHRDRVASIDER